MITQNIPTIAMAAGTSIDPLKPLCAALRRMTGNIIIKPSIAEIAPGTTILNIKIFSLYDVKISTGKPRFIFA